MSVQEQKKKRKHRMKEKKRRKKDNMIGMPFIIAFQGDPARSFYCNDVIDNGIHTYELLHEHNTCSLWGYVDKAFARLARYCGNYVVTMNGKLLIYKAGEVPDPYIEQEEREEEDCPATLIKLARTDFERACVTEFVTVESDIRAKFAAIKRDSAWVKWLIVAVFVAIVISKVV